MRTQRVVVLVAAVIVTVVVVGVAGAGSLRANQRAARKDAAVLLVRARLPVGAVGIGHEPAGDDGYLKPMVALEGDAARVVVHAWWEVPGSLGGVVAYVRAHPPAGSRLAGAGTDTNRRTGTSALSLSFQWPAVPGVLGSRELILTATALPDGQTGVLAQVQTDWIERRAESERIPARTRLIDIASGSSTAKPIITISVSDPLKVTQIVSLINRLPITQPVQYLCPLMMDPRPITIVFRAAAATRPLAILRYQDYRPWSGPSGGCKTVDLTIDSRPQHPLDGGTFLTSIERLLGQRLT